MDGLTQKFSCILFLRMGDKTSWSAPAVGSNVTPVSSPWKDQPMRTNVSRWDPVLVGLVQDGGAAAKTSELWSVRRFWNSTTTTGWEKRPMNKIWILQLISGTRLKSTLIQKKVLQLFILIKWLPQWQKAGLDPSAVCISGPWLQ